VDTKEEPSGGPPNLVVFPYDWRQDLALTAEKLADRIVQLYASHGGSCAITLLAHSTGGLIARCLLESGEFDDRLGAARGAIRDLIMMGTAGKGAPEALGGIMGLEGLLFLSPDQAARLAAAPKYPAAYQHLPAPGTMALWGVAATLPPQDLYASDVAQKLGLDGGHQASAIDFWSKLAFPLLASTAPRYFGFVGTHQLTLTGYGYDSNSSGAAALSPHETEDGGDGTVPIWSAGEPELQVQYVGGSHTTIFDDAELKARLIELIPPGPNAIVGLDTFNEQISRAIDLSTRHLVPRPRVRADHLPREMIVSLRIGSAVTPTGDVVVEGKHLPRARRDEVDQASWRSGQYDPVKRIPVGLPNPPPCRHGVPIGSVTDFKPGQYRAYFLPSGAKTPAGRCAYFIVQDNHEKPTLYGRAGGKAKRRGGEESGRARSAPNDSPVRR
jgi:hypothetical protein